MPHHTQFKGGTRSHTTGHTGKRGIGVPLVQEDYPDLPLSSMTGLLGQKTRLGLPMGFLMAPCAKSYEILSRIIAQSAPGFEVMNLKTLDAPARLATPAVSL